MEIAVNTRLLLKDRLEGIGRFSYEILKRLVISHPEVTFHFFFDRKYDDEFIFGDNVIPHIVSPPTRHPILQYIWFHHQLPKAIRATNAQVFFSPETYNAINIDIPSIITPHDLNFVHFPDLLPWSVQKYYRYFVPKYIQSADHIVTVSEFSKNDIVKQYATNENKISVVYNGHEHIKPSQKGSKDHYFLYVGSLNERKNIETVLKAFDHFKKSDNEDYQLIVVGKKMFSSEKIEAVYKQMKHKSDVIFTGYVSDSELNDYYQKAKVLLYLSHFEGFGIPVIEAFKAETPVISSNSTSLPEVGGSASLQVDPLDYLKVADYLDELLTNPIFYEERVKAGKKQLTKFSWDNSAKQLWEILKDYART